MGEIRVNIEDESLLTRLGDVARSNNRSIGEEIEAMLRNVFPPRREDLRALANSVAAMTPKGVKQTDIVEMLREDRNR